MDCVISDGTNVQHLLEMGLHIVIHVTGYASVALCEGLPICYLNSVFNLGSSTQVQVAAGKQVFPFKQQCPGLFLLSLRPFP